MSDVASIGIDAGSTVLKIVGIDNEKRIVFQIIEPSEPIIEDQINKHLENLKIEFDLDFDELSVVATGYGSSLVKLASKRVTEITCHAKGMFEFFKKSGTIIDIGGQDSKVILIDNNGHVSDFMMNDKCAAGTGRFLETTAWRLKIPIDKMGKMALEADSEVEISSTCAVFAESEVISHLARGKDLKAVIRGLHRSLVKRVIAMANVVGIETPVMLSGGVVKNPSIVRMIEEELKEKPLLPDNPQIVGAFGAAILGLN